MVDKEILKRRFNTTAICFKFKLEAEFEDLFEIIFNQVKDFSQQEIDKKFQQLWLTPIDKWHKKYGFAGYPPLSDWINILTGKRPLQDEELSDNQKRHEQALTFFTQSIICWLEDPNINHSFVPKYLDKENSHLRKIIDQFCSIKEELPEDRIVKMAVYLRDLRNKDKQDFFFRFRNIADSQNKILLN